MNPEPDNALERILAEQEELASRLRALEESEALRGLLREQADLNQRLAGLERDIEALAMTRPGTSAAAHAPPADAAPAAKIPLPAGPPPLPAGKPQPATAIGIACPQCALQFSSDESLCGTDVDCPNCGARVHVRVPERDTGKCESEAEAEAARARRPEPVLAPKPAPAPAPAARASRTAEASGGIELKLGTYWLVRIGVVMVLTGLVFLANFFVMSEDIAPGVKVFALYVISFLLLGAGAWIERTREQMRNYGQVLAAGGLAAVYFTTYAAHKVPALTIISSPLLAGILLLVWAGFMVFLADWKKSQTLAVMGVLLAYYTLLIDSVSLFSLWSALILSGVALVFLVRNRWIVVGFVSLAGTYLSFAYWRYPYLLEWWQSHPPASDAFWPEYGFLICYWAVFTAAAFLSSREHIAMERRSSFAGFNNAAFLVLFGLGMARYHPEEFWIFSLISGVVCLALCEFARRRFAHGDMLADIYLLKGLVLVTLAFLIKLSGVSLALTLAAESSVLLVVALRRKNALLEIGANISAIAAVFYTLVSESVGPGKIWFLEFPGDVPGFAALGQMLFLFFNAWWVRRDEIEVRESEFELRACLFLVLGIVAATIGALVDLEPGYRALGFMAAGMIAGTAGAYGPRRFRELAVFGQAFSILGIGFFLFRHAEIGSGPAPPLWQTVPVLISTLALVHWSAHEKGLPLAKPSRNIFQFVFAIGFTLSVAVFAVVRLPDERAWLYLGGLMALAQLFYGFRMRLVALGSLSQFYQFIVFVQLIQRGHDALLSAIAIFLLVANVLVISEARHRLAVAKTLGGGRRKLIDTALFVLRMMGLVMFAVTLYRHVGQPWQSTVTGAAAIAMLVLAILRCDGQRILFSLFLLGIGSFHLFADALNRSGLGEWQWYLACLVPLCMQQILRNLPIGEAAALPESSGKKVRLPVLRREEFLDGLHVLFAVLGAALLWFVLSNDVAELKRGFYLTVSWSLLSFGIFAAGWFLHERLYRLLGLLILGTALVRVLAVDVWALDQVARIVSFIVIGLVLLALGFAYTRYQETLRRYF